MPSEPPLPLPAVSSTREHDNRNATLRVLIATMDPKNPDSYNHRTELLSTGKKYHFVDQIPTKYNPTTTPTLLCIHGFPDIW